MAKSDLVNVNEAAVLAGVTEPLLRIYAASGSILITRDEAGLEHVSKADIDSLAVEHKKAIESARKASLDETLSQIVALRLAVSALTRQIDKIASVEREPPSMKPVEDMLEKVRAENEKHAGTVANLQKMVEDTIGKAQTALQQDMGKMFSTVGNLVDDVAALQRRQTQIDPDSATKPIEKRLATAEQQLEQVAASVQRLLAESTRVQDQIASVTKQNKKLVGSLLSALDANEPSAESAESPKASLKAPIDLDEPEEESPRRKIAQAKLESAENGRETAVKVPVKPGVKREIEFNYLLQRMGFKRLDAYEPHELEEPGQPVLPDDEAIRKFLGTYELGCAPDEVAFVNLQRAEYHMIQYQRVEKAAANLRGWIPRKK